MIRTGVRTSVSAWLLFGCAAVGWAGELPLESAWAELDGPQPRGPGPMLVFRQAPQNSWGPAADLAGHGNAGNPGWQRNADEFAFVSDALVSRVVWWGFYGDDVTYPPESPPSAESFWIRVYQPRPSDGLPGVLLHEEVATNPVRAATGRILGTGVDQPEYKFTFDTANPFTLIANQVYWLEITQIDLPQSLFRWVVSPGTGTPYAFQSSVSPIQDWQRDSGTPNLAFEIYSIPEPSSAAALALGCVLLRRRIRKDGAII